jgi:phospholipase C
MSLWNKGRAIVLAPFILIACSQHSPSPSQQLLPAAAPLTASHPQFVASDKIKHIVFIVQENRTFDSIFGGPNPLPGADAASEGQTFDGTRKPLQPINLQNPNALTDTADPNNYHTQWLLACNAPPGAGPPFNIGGPSPCRMNGFSRNAQPLPGYPVPPATLDQIYSYVEYDETQPYWFIAQHYAVGDRFFMGHNSESYTGHQYIFSSQSNDTVDAPVFPSSLNCGIKYLYCAYTPWGCDSPSGTRMYLLDPTTGLENGPPASPSPVKPCFGTETKIPYYSLADRVAEKGLPWRMYARSMCSGIVALDVNKTIRYSKYFQPDGSMANCHDSYGFKTTLGSKTNEFRIPEYQFPTDEQAGASHLPLASMTWVLPGPITSDHPGVTLGYCGPWWVASVINAIGENTADWNSTAIFVFWDDWGGFYDHVPPYVVRDQAGPGFRVPLLVISPYVRKGVIHTNTEFGTLNKFVETTLGLQSLNATDASPTVNNMNDFFDFNQKPQAFQKVPYDGVVGQKIACSSFKGSLRHAKGAPEPRWFKLVGAGDND